MRMYVRVMKSMLVSCVYEVLNRCVCQRCVSLKVLEVLVLSQADGLRKEN